MVCRITETYEQTSLHPRVNWRIAPFSLWMRASAGSPLKEGPIYSTQSPPAHRRCPQRDAGLLRVSLSAEKWLQCHAVRKAAQGVCLTDDWMKDVEAGEYNSRTAPCFTSSVHNPIRLTVKDADTTCRSLSYHLLSAKTDPDGPSGTPGEFPAGPASWLSTPQSCC